MSQAAHMGTATMAFLERVHVASRPHGHSHDGLRALRDLGLHRSRVHIQSFIDLCEHRYGPEFHHGLDWSDERKAGGYDFIASSDAGGHEGSLDSGGHEGSLDCCGSGGNGVCVAHAEKRRYLLLQLSHGVAFGAVAV